MSSLLEKIDELVNKEIVNNGDDKETVIIKMTEDMLKSTVADRVRRRGIEDFDVLIDNEAITFKGALQKLLIKTSFEAVLKPLKVENQTLFFELKKMKPLNQEWIKNKLFNRPPYLTYEKGGNLSVHLNEIGSVPSLNLEDIQGISVQDGALALTIANKKRIALG